MRTTVEPESQQKIVRIIELGIEQIAAQRDELKAENERLREQNETQTQECEAHNNAYVYEVNEALGLRAEVERLREALASAVGVLRAANVHGGSVVDEWAELAKEEKADDT